MGERSPSLLALTTCLFLAAGCSASEVELVKSPNANALDAGTTPDGGSGQNNDGDVDGAVGPALEGLTSLRIEPTQLVAEDDGVLNSWCLIPTPGQQAVSVAPRVILEGPYDGGTGLMADVLRGLPGFPLTEPYSGLGYTHVGGGGGETVAPAVLATTGPDAIVDWVLVELRDGADASNILASRAALLQRDGDVVDTDVPRP